MAFEEQFNLEDAEDFLEGVNKPSVTAGLLGASYALYKDLANKQLQLGLYSNNIVRNRVTGQSYYSPQIQGSIWNKVKMLGEHALNSETRDAAHLLNKVIEERALPFNQRIYTEQLDNLNRNLPQKSRIGTPLYSTHGPRGKYPQPILTGWDYTGIQKGDANVVSKMKAAIRQGPVNSLINFKSKNPSIGALIAEGEYIEATKMAEDFENRIFSPEGRKLRALRHERLAKPLIKQSAGRILNSNDLKVFTLEGLSEPVKSEAGALFSGHHKKAMAKWGFGKNDRVTWSKIINQGDKAIMASSIKDSWHFKIQQYVTDHIQPVNGKIKHSDIKRLANEAVDIMRDAYKGRFGRGVPHGLDKIDDALAGFLRKGNVEIRGNKIISNMSPMKRTNYLLGGVNANIVTYFKDIMPEAINSSSITQPIKERKLFYDVLVSDKYDATGALAQKNTHLTFHRFSNDKTVRKKKRVTAFNPRQVKPIKDKLLKKLKTRNLEGTLNLLKSAKTKANSRVKADLLRKKNTTERTAKAVKNLAISKAQSLIEKTKSKSLGTSKQLLKLAKSKKGKAGATLSAAVLAALAYDKFTK